MKALSFKFEATKLTRILYWFWILTVFSSFFDSELLSFTVPGLGELYPFRILLPLSGCLFLAVAFRQKINFWKYSSLLEKLCYLLIAALLIASALSLRVAIDFDFSFRRLFNLCFDLALFFLAIQLCRDARFMKATVITLGSGFALMCLLGAYEIAFGGIFSDTYDNMRTVPLLYGNFQYPTVTFSNTNDYTTTLVFCLAIVLLYWARHYISTRKHLWVPLVSVPVCFFLTYMATSRLAMICMWIILAGLIAFFFLQSKKHRWVPIFFLIVYLTVTFMGNFRYIVPRAEAAADNTVGYVASSADTDEKALENTPSDRQLFNSDELNNTIRNNLQSDAVRVNLLKHAFACFVDSYGMGVGLGNTEQLAKLGKVAAEGRIWSIHCFVARLIGDLGIFALLPLALIIIKLLAILVKGLHFHHKARNKQGIALLLLTISLVFIYPFLSTTSSDAQDILAMWLYLGILVPFAVQLQTDKPAA